MGYTSGWSSIRELKEHLLKSCEGPNRKVLASRATNYGRHLWVAIQYLDTGTSFIALFLISKSMGQWGYKDMDESCGPYVKDCPLELLNMTTGDGHQYSIEWRKAVREASEKRKAISAGLTIGEIVEVYGEKYKIVEKKKRTWIGVDKFGRRYKLRTQHIVRLDNATDFILNKTGEATNDLTE